MTQRLDPDEAGIVLNIQRFSVHDGPGIRTVVFIKGCSLRCDWCSNPESMSRSVQIGVYRDRCIGTDKCTACLDAAPDKAAIVVKDRRVVGLETGHPEQYLACAESCPTGALKAWGRKMTVDEVMQEVVKDMEFYRESGGGLTLSGGESLIQTKFAAELLKAARSEGINTCVETALNYRSGILDEVLPFVDLFLCDVKHLDSVAHKRFTGVPNERILENLGKVVDSGVPVVVRIPVVPGLNGTEVNLRATAKYIADQLGGRVIQIQLLPFRKLGVEKYASLGIPYPMEDFETPAREVWEKDLQRFADMMATFGLNATAGSGATITI